ncbi:hypothetical protein CTheo_7816 [Ceratobasidium theobromae]|uniref:BTB domain-containing protein n=1 Tax=Ceratobasidium theobromae TaxID=1582974 RepID=A0A5N5QAS5_9AGAM|nr:hypothetical protein CTheo_7816 [Ceratobasidium theobromae]
MSLMLSGDPILIANILTTLFNNEATEQGPNPPEDFVLKPCPSYFGFGNKVGDAIICTLDHAVYSVHFDILASVSPVFKSLLLPGISGNWYEINETSTIFSIFLQLAYARDVPEITSFPAFDVALEVCEKYQLRIMKRLLRGFLSDKDSHVCLEKDPLLAFGVALKHNFPQELAFASRLLIRSINLRDTQNIQLLHSSSTGARILSMIALRHSRLADLLLSNDCGIVQEDPEIVKQLTCQSCFGNCQNLNPSHRHVHWIARWTQDAYEILLYSCVTQQPKLFTVAYVLEMMTGPKWCGECRARIVANVSLYEVWMSSIRDRLEQHLVQELQI